jgi:hypothetical protein
MAVAMSEITAVRRVVKQLPAEKLQQCLVQAAVCGHGRALDLMSAFHPSRYTSDVTVAPLLQAFNTSIPSFTIHF